MWDALICSIYIFKLKPVDEAFYASKSRATGTNGCLPQTHVPALRTIRDWVNSESSSPMFWLCGSAGSGKSTIAYTIAQEWSHSGASFFFSRARLSLRESRLVFQTIAFQLRDNYPVLRAPISRALEDRTVLAANSETQLHKFVLDPILQTQSHLPDRLVIVIDALDECDDNTVHFLIMHKLIMHISHNASCLDPPQVGWYQPKFIAHNA